MPKNLFTCSLSEISFDDVKLFLLLDEPISNRVSEGLRIDYKEEIPLELGKTIAAFANTYGGIIILGVEETNGKPGVITGCLRGKTDLKTRVASKIRDSVIPQPTISITVLDVPQSESREIAILRVEPGDYPPYMFTQHKTIPIRNHDQNVPASLRELEQLFATRSRLGLRSDGISEGVLDGAFYVEEGIGNGLERRRASTLLRVGAALLPGLNIRLDRRSEIAVHRIINRVFEVVTPAPSARRADYFELERNLPGGDPWQRWRFSSVGALSYSTKLARPDGSILLDDVIKDVVRTLIGAKTILEHFGAGGRVAVELELASSEALLHAGRDIGTLQTKAHLPTATQYGLLDVTELSAPTGFVSDSIRLLLRETRGADLEFEALTDYVDAIVASEQVKERRSRGPREFTLSQG